MGASWWSLMLIPRNSGWRRRIVGRRTVNSASTSENSLDGSQSNRVNGYHKKGAHAFITKPFPTESHTLASVIRKVLEDHLQERVVSQARGGAAATARFAGGELVFFDDHVELLGVKIMSDRGAGLTMLVLGELRRRDPAGRYLRLSADELAGAVGAIGGVGTITGCIRGLRRNIVTRLRRHLNIDARHDDVIGHDEQGYCLRDWIVAKDGTAAVGDAPAAPADDPGRGGDAAPADLNERQEWVLRELQRGTKVRRVLLEQKFDVADKTAKRDLADLTSRGAFEFVREGRDGYYRLAQAAQG